MSICQAREITFALCAPSADDTPADGLDEGVWSALTNELQQGFPCVGGMISAVSASVMPEGSTASSTLVKHSELSNRGSNKVELIEEVPLLPFLLSPFVLLNVVWKLATVSLLFLIWQELKAGRGR